jgi:site-specific DNA recombinase
VDANGYRPAANPKGKGFVLEQDPKYAKVIRDMVDMVLKGYGPTAIANWLNDHNTPTSKDILRIRKGQEPKGLKWRYPSVLNILRSRAMCGITELDGQIVYDDDAMPVRFGEPIIDDATYDKVQDALDKLSKPRNRKRKDSPWLVGVTVCYSCGAPMQTKRQRNRKEGNKVFEYMERYSKVLIIG